MAFSITDYVVQKFETLEFLSPLADAMTKYDAKDRPTLHGCTELLEDLVRQQPPRVLLRLLIRQSADTVTRLMRSFGFLRREFAFMMRSFSC